MRIIPAARCARGLLFLTALFEKRAQGMPDARCTRGLVCKRGKKRTRAYRFSGGTPTFPAQWLYGLLRALPGDQDLFVTVAPRMMAGPTPGWAGFASAGLDANHEASGPHDFAVRFGIVRPARRCPLTENRPANTLHARRRRVHRIPSQRSVTMANAPSSGTGWRES